VSLAPARPAPSDVDLAHLEAPDRVSVKPHASPALHAINFLLGRLDESYLPRLREFGGLQSYPSRSKDPDPVDFSTGSVGIGATAVIWRALAHRYVAGHFDVPRGGRVIALLGDAELDEGAVWEAIADPMVAHLGEVLWVVVHTSPDLVFAALQARSGLGPGGWEVLERAFPRPRPIVAVVDGIRTRSRSSPPSTASRSPAWG
jgi:pyruvate dehydrogenase E1 component